MAKKDKKKDKNDKKVEELPKSFPESEIDCPEICDGCDPKNVKRLANKNECELECTKDKKQVDYVEYIGNVHISLIAPPGYVYRKTMAETALLNFAYFLIGATVMFTIYYTLMMKHHWAMNLHMFLGTLGSQIFMPAYFLTLNPLEGAAIFGKSTDKRKSACILNCVGVGCLWAAAASLVLYWKYFVKFSFHSVAGFAGVAFSGLNFLSSCCLTADEDSTIGLFAQFICVPAYVFSTLSFASAMFKPSMVNWYPEKNMNIILTILCVVYTLIIIYRPIKNYFA